MELLYFEKLFLEQKQIDLLNGLLLVMKVLIEKVK
jgi:hypothetical protein